MSLDVVLRGGTVVDGTGAEPRRADVGLAGGRIAVVGEVPVGDAALVDVTGLVVAPGFVDIHSHSDYTLLVDPRAVSAIYQGVTTEVVGNCGHGCFPVRDVALARTAIYGYDETVPLDWTDAGGYLDRLEAAHPAVNVLTLVPNGQLRLATVGLAERPATPAERAAMAAHLREALADGAWGYSTGLEYAAEAGADEAEVSELAAVAAASGGLYATHTRHRDEGAVEAVDEALRTARRTAVRLQVSHLVPRGGPEPTARCIEAVERARADGLDVEFDMHTRRYGLTHLFAALPPEALGASREGLERFLADPGAAERIRRHRSILSAGGDWSRVVLLDSPFWPELAGRDLEGIAAGLDTDPADAIRTLLLGAVDDPHRLLVVIHAYSEEQQRDAFAHPLCVPGSDATTLAPDGPLARCRFDGAYGWAAWFYRYMVRETGLLTTAEAVRRLTARPAARIGLTDRGLLREGLRADLAVFDADRFGERATLAEPNLLAEGMRHVFVNGVHTVRDGVPTGARGGKVLRR